MTLQEVMIKNLVEMGMFENHASQVLELCKEQKEMEPMTTRWNDQETDYPAVLYKVLFLRVAQVAYGWIEENVPKAWYKPLFEPYA